VFSEGRGKTAQQRELYRKRARAPGKDITVSGKEEAAHVRGALRRSSITSQEVEMSTRITRSEARRRVVGLQGPSPGQGWSAYPSSAAGTEADPCRGLRTGTRGELG